MLISYDNLLLNIYEIVWYRKLWAYDIKNRLYLINYFNISLNILEIVWYKHILDYDSNIISAKRLIVYMFLYRI